MATVSLAWVPVSFGEVVAMRRLVTVPILILFLSLAGVLTASAAPAQRRMPLPQKIPFEGMILAEHGCGIEDIRISGTILLLFSPFHIGYQGVQGVGLDTGTRYSVTFTNTEVFIVRGPGELQSFHSVGSIRHISFGPMTNFRSQGHFHLVYRPDGSVKEMLKFREEWQ
jgi:hypothetical protein